MKKEDIRLYNKVTSTIKNTMRIASLKVYKIYTVYTSLISEGWTFL